MSLRKRSFKWFGSLTNISFRRSTEKSDSKASKSGDDDECAASAKLSPVLETTLDDLGAMRPRTTSYVRSSEDYTHVGTLPRLLMRKRVKSSKGIHSSKKTKNKSESQRPAGEKNEVLQTPTGSKTSEGKAEVTADTGLKEVSSAEGQEKILDVSSANFKTQSEPVEDATINQNMLSGPTASSKEVLPSGGSDAALQSDERKALNPEETFVSQERQETIESDGLELKEEEENSETDEEKAIYW
ncbi:hypothetical protein ATANTOWER_016359 [Ataeniobius toweri]|uniref:Uncharacterized protein n=1 Tax=Ataeniobius toweri TaxID=208326 RepID=A0ABU7BH06_9TELE|nr:hypothetical protein [Ataeniobius toweri]